MKILLDLKIFDKVKLSKEERDRFVWKLLFISDTARKLNKNGKLSKTMLNRINRLWLFLPREENQREVGTIEEFHNLFHIKSLDIKELKIALNKFEKELKQKLKELETKK